MYDKTKIPNPLVDAQAFVRWHCSLSPEDKKTSHQEALQYFKELDTNPPFPQQRTILTWEVRRLLSYCLVGTIGILVYGFTVEFTIPLFLLLFVFFPIPIGIPLFIIIEATVIKIMNFFRHKEK